MGLSFGWGRAHRMCPGFEERCVTIVTHCTAKDGQDPEKSESHRSQSFALGKIATQSGQSIDGTKVCGTATRSRAAAVQYGLPLGSSAPKKTMPVLCGWACACARSEIRDQRSGLTQQTRVSGRTKHCRTPTKHCFFAVLIDFLQGLICKYQNVSQR